VVAAVDDEDKAITTIDVEMQIITI